MRSASAAMPRRTSTFAMYCRLVLAIIVITECIFSRHSVKWSTEATISFLDWPSRVTWIKSCSPFVCTNFPSSRLQTQRSCPSYISPRYSQRNPKKSQPCKKELSDCEVCGGARCRAFSTFLYPRRVGYDKNGPPSYSSDAV
jgi:hypothetical protein